MEDQTFPGRLSGLSIEEKIKQLRQEDHQFFVEMDDDFEHELVQEYWEAQNPGDKGYETDSDFIAGALWSIAKSLNRLNILIVKGYTRS
jgi:hypothetical protein